MMAEGLKARKMGVPPFVNGKLAAEGKCVLSVTTAL